MSQRRIIIYVNALLGLLILVLLGTGCNTTRHIPDGQYLLKSNTIKLKSDQPITRKGELKENLQNLVVQKPNTTFLIFPYKLWLYNNRYEKYKKDSANFQLRSKTVEPPVIYDSSSKRRSVINMQGYLFHSGYFYSTIEDTTKFKKKKAYVTYEVNTGQNYLINKVYPDIPDSTINAIVASSRKQSHLQTNVEFSYDLLEMEQSRITALLRDYGYYFFSNNNVSFELDTLNKQYLRDLENPFESAIDFIALQKDKKKPTLDIKMFIRTEDEPRSFTRYGVNRLRVFPDYVGGSDFRDTTMRQTTVSKVIFKYHKYYVKENVLLRNIFLEPDRYYSQSEYDQTISRLNELGVFQSIRISFTVDTVRPGNWLNANIFLSPTPKFDFSTGIEATTGSVYGGAGYFAGTAVTAGLRNRNVAKGANALTTSASGGIEYSIEDNVRLRLLTRSFAGNLTYDMPRFLLPIKQSAISRRNSPRTAISTGINYLERIDNFTMINTAAAFSYRWFETETKRWEVSPAFVNWVSLPYTSPQFQELLKTNEWLRNVYNNTFIEGENVTFSFTDKARRIGRNYTNLKLGIEEAGLLYSALNKLSETENNLYSQYVRFDFDAQHFFLQRHSSEAFRFTGGIGVPYNLSPTLPYIKQYFVGGPYSIRGWRIRTLGPGSYRSSASTSDSVVIDRIGDIKLELNGEFRFDVIQLFAGALNLKGALFADAGNIWLARKSDDFPDGEFNFKYLLNDVALNTGFGARIDVAGFFIVRFDWGLPLKNPSRDDSGWIPPRDWKLVLQFGVGYPF